MELYNGARLEFKFVRAYMGLRNMMIAMMATMTTTMMMTVTGLETGFYGATCPMADSIVRSTVNKALQSDPTLAAALLRLHFQDCFVEGCDGSVLIDSTDGNTAEKDSPANLSLRGFEVIDAAKKALEEQCPNTVSCADILAMAARNAVFFAGGPFYPLPNGRRDGRRSRIEDTIRVPAPTLNSSKLIRIFAQHGFTTRQMVALFGGHSLGVARCATFKHRLNNFDSSNDVDPSLDTQFARTLSETCSAGDNTTQPFDSTRNRFDNHYFRALQKGEGVLFSDQTLWSGAATRGIVEEYAMSQALFFSYFQSAMVKMGMMDVKEGSAGELRVDCRVINN